MKIVAGLYQDLCAQTETFRLHCISHQTSKYVVVLPIRIKKDTQGAFAHDAKTPQYTAGVTTQQTKQKQNVFNLLTFEHIGTFRNMIYFVNSGSM